MLKNFERLTIARQLAPIAAIWAIALAPHPVAAGPVPEATFAAGAGPGAAFPAHAAFGPFTKIGSAALSDSYFSATSCGDDCLNQYSGSAVTTGFPKPSLSATAFADSFINAAFASSASVSYYFSSLGPPDIDVPVIFEASGGVTGLESGSASLYGGFALAEIVGLTAGRACLANGPVGCSPAEGEDRSFSIRQTVLAPSNNFENIYIYASASVNRHAFAGDRSTTALTLSVDPIVYIDPSFPLADEFSIVVSPGVGNPPPSAPAIPEPTSLALLLTGLVAIARRAATRSPSVRVLVVSGCGVRTMD